MRLFVSHATTDLEVAEVLKLRLEEVPGLKCSIVESDLAAGEDWERRIRTEAAECDAIACVVTPEYLKRPWFYAEWAAFWFQDKTWFSLLAETSPDAIFEVMRRRQVTLLADRRSVERLLRALAVEGAPTRGIDLLAEEIVRAVADARHRALIAGAVANLDELRSRLQEGQENVRGDLVDRLIRADQVTRIVDAACDASVTSPTKLRQLACILVERGLAADAAKFTNRIANGAERRTVGKACLRRLKEVDSDDPARALVLAIYLSARDPQRRDLRDYSRQLDLKQDWPVTEPNP